jgi:hypothetical protein
MQNVSERKIVFYGLLFIGIILVILAFFTEVPAGGADNYAHYNISKWAFRYPNLFLDHWGKPVFTILTAPFSQLGFWGVRIFNIISGLLTAFMAYKLARLFDLKLSWFTLISVIFTPIYLVMMSSGMTEILFSLILIVSVYLFFKEKYIYASILISFIFLVRTEGLAFLILFLAGFLIRKQYKAIPFMFTGFLIFSAIGGLYYYHDVLWLITRRPYATNSGFSVYGHGTWFHYLIKLPLYYGYIVPFMLFGGTIIILMQWLKEGNKWRSLPFLQILLVLGSFWGYFFIHSFLWWKGETSAGLYRVMAAVSPVASIIGVFAMDYVVKKIPWKFVKNTFMLILSVYLVGYASIYYRESLAGNPNTEIQKRVTQWLKDSGSIHHKLVMHDPYFAFSTGLDAWNSRVVQYGFSNNDVPENGLPDSTIFIWDAHFSANEGQLPLEKIIQNTNFELVRVFYPVIPFKVLGGNDFRIVIFRKTKIPQFNNATILERISKGDFDKGVYYYDEMNFEQPFAEQQMEIRRMKSTSEGQNFMYDLKGTEFSPAFVVPTDKIKKGIHNKIRLAIDIFRIDQCSPDRLLMVYSIEKEGHSFHYVTADLNGHIPEKNRWYKVDFTFDIPDLNEKNSIIKVYIWNIEKYNILIDNFKLEIAEQNQ